MSKRKFKKGALITSLDEYYEHDYFIVRGELQHAGWCRSWQMALAKHYIEKNNVFVAVRLTNEEYYEGKTNEEMMDIVGNLCEYCPLPESARGVHSAPSGYSACEGSRCSDAFENWLEHEVE